MKEWLRKAINRLICSKNWETPIISMGTRKSSPMVWRVICHDVEVEPAYYYRYAQSLRSIGEMTKQIKLWKNLIKCQETTVEGTFAKNENYMDAIRLIPEDIK
jgi:hypothetical protein